jgi:hypothetical protein
MKRYVLLTAHQDALQAMEKMILLVALIAWLLAASAFAARKDKLAMARSAQPKWTELDLIGLREGFRENLPLSDIAGQLLRTEDEVADKARELGIKLRVV